MRAIFLALLPERFLVRLQQTTSHRAEQATVEDIKLPSALVIENQPRHKRDPRVADTIVRHIDDLALIKSQFGNVCMLFNKAFSSDR